MDFSDDEQERAAWSKGRRRGSGRRGEQTTPTVATPAVATATPRPDGFYAPTASSTTACTTMPQSTPFAQAQPVQPEESDTIYYD